MSQSFLTRFAPSPTGFLHIGHAYAAMQAFGAGACLLRIEDIDQTRCRTEFETAIYEDLSWLGFSWETPVRRQSDHFTDYTSVLARLSELGLVYRCGLSRKEINAHLEEAGVETSQAGEKPFRRTLLKSDHIIDEVGSFAWRLDLDACRDYLGPRWFELGFEETGCAPGVDPGWVKAHPDWLGDVILARKDTPTSYHLSVCHDDALQGITQVTRGRDLVFATHIHVVLQAVLDWPTPVYAHHGLLLGPDGRKFSKSEMSKTIRSLREEGVKPEDLLSTLRNTPAE